MAKKKVEKERVKVPEKWTRNERESGLLEYVCEHGVGHPDYVSAMRVADRYKHPLSVWLTHGCDGCCSQVDFPGRPPKKRRSSF